MLIGLSGYLTGYDGNFAFDKPGDKYENVSYIGMRVVSIINITKINQPLTMKFQFCTAMGAALIPMTYIIVDELTQSVIASTISSLLILFGKFSNVMIKIIYQL